ncbi:hypothetical protein ACWGH2_42145 [Streptomyces sp. NPDC054871]
MSYDDERRDVVDGEDSALFRGAGPGQAPGAHLLAAWHLMQCDDAPEDGEADAAAGEVDFVPLSDEELDERLAALDGMDPDPLPDVIENLSDAGQFLMDDKAGDPGPATAAVRNIHRTRYKQVHSLRYPGMHLGCTASSPVREFNRLDRDRSAVFVACLFPTADLKYEDSVRHLRVPEIPDLRVWKKAFLRGLRETCYEQVLRETFGIPAERLRGAVRAYLVREDLLIAVESAGALKNPRAELQALASRATSFTTAADEAGRWALLFGVDRPPLGGRCAACGLASAPARDPEHCDTVHCPGCGAIQPALSAVLELPGGEPFWQATPHRWSFPDPAQLPAELERAVAALTERL